MTIQEEMDRYIRRIRNLKKRQYAQQYARYLLSLTEEPTRGELSVMGAQAVQIQLRKILGSSR
jgi:hypothetical protein